MDKSLREKLNEKYYKIPNNKHNKDRDAIEFYKSYFEVLNELLSEIKILRKNYECFLTKGFNRRQIGCIERITKEHNGWNNEFDEFNQRYYELTDFIYYPGFEYGSITQEEFSTIEIMANYLISIAKQKLENI